MKKFILYSMLCGLLLSACGSSSLQSFAPWAVNPRIGCAVGIMKHRGNESLSKTGATSRARNSLASQLESRVASLIKDYQSQGEIEGKGFSEELITQASKQSVKQTLIGTRLKHGRRRSAECPTLL